jgi:hypothetical protein
MEGYMKTIRFILLTILLCLFFACDETSDYKSKDKWILTFKVGNWGANGKSICQMEDGNYLVTGDAWVDPTGVYSKRMDLFVAKISSDGKAITQKMFGGGGWERGNVIMPAIDGDYLIFGGWNETLQFYTGVYIIKINSSLTELFSKILQIGKYPFIARSAKTTSDLNYIVAGSPGVCNEGDSRFNLAKLDNQLNIIWNKSFGYPDLMYEVNSVIETIDGGFFIVGSAYSFISNTRDIYYIKTDKEGNEVYSNTFKASGQSNAYDVVQVANGDYVIVGETKIPPNNNLDMLFLKISSNGEILDWKTYGGPEYDSAHKVLLEDNSLILTGSTNKNSGGAFLMNMDLDWNKIWFKTYATFSTGYDVIKTNDGGYIIVGTGSIPDKEDEGGIILIKTDSNGNAE